MPDWLDSLLNDELGRRESAHQLRTRRVMKPLDAVHVEINGRRLVNFSSNNYLGLTHHPKVLGAQRAATEAGSGAAGLISGYTPVHQSAEQAIARWKRTQNAVLMSSGYQANSAAVQTMAALGKTRGGVRFLLDKLVHASLLDAVAATGESWRTFGHNRIDRLEQLLREANAKQLQVVITESIFSMDGDRAELAAIAHLKSKYRFIFLVDEAHGSGVYGKNGAGLIEETSVNDAVDVTIVTLSKAVGCGGGAVCGSDSMCKMLVNSGRGYVFSTSIPPPTSAAIESAIGVMQQEPHRQQRVRALANDVRARLSKIGFQLPTGDSPIIPIILGDESAAMNASKQLEERGLLIAPIRPPTVARRTSRLRVTLSCEHSDEEILRLVEELKKLN